MHALTDPRGIGDGDLAADLDDRPRDELPAHIDWKKLATVLRRLEEDGADVDAIIIEAFAIVEDEACGRALVRLNAKLFGASKLVAAGPPDDP